MPPSQNQQNVDQLVKGGLNVDDESSSTAQSSDPVSSFSPPSDSQTSVQSLSPSSASSIDPQQQNSTAAKDPLFNLPSSPPQIYLNLLILEASLRAQYLSLRERRRQYSFFLLLLAAWIVYFSYALFFRPREDGSGVGGSIYWMVEMGEKLALMGGIVTALLVWGTGQWERGIRWPRRWLAVTNRGLRIMNTKVILVRGPWWRELLSYMSFLFPFFPSPAGNFCYVERHLVEKRSGKQQQPQQQHQQQHHHHHHHHHNQHHHHHDGDTGLVEEDLNPGGDYLRLLLLPKTFSPEFRENWDDYRISFWEKENERRAQLREKLHERERLSAQRDGGFLWWFGLWRLLRRRKTVVAAAVANEKSQPNRNRRRSSIPKLQDHLKHSSSRRGTISETGSRNSSRSSTPAGTGGDSLSGGGRSSRVNVVIPSSPSEHSSRPAPPASKRSSDRLSPHVSPLTQAQARESSLDDPFASLSGDKDGNESRNSEVF